MKALFLFAILLSSFPLSAAESQTITVHRTERPDRLAVTIEFPAAANQTNRKGLTPFGSEGDPEVYGRLLHVAIPAGSDVSLELKAAKFDRISATARSFDGQLLNPAKLEKIYPAKPVWISPSKKFRSVEYVDVFVFPIRFNLHGQQAILTRSISFELVFSKVGSGRIKEKDPIAKFNDRFFLNEWRDKRGDVHALKAPAAAWQPPAHTGTVYKIVVRNDGVYSLDTAFLSANTDWNIASVDPRNLRLFNLGNEVPVQVAGESDGTLDPGDALTFYGQPYVGENDAGVWQSGDFTDENVYWLLVGAVNGLRMSTRDVTPTNTFTVPTEFVSTEHFEVNTGQYGFQTQPDTDQWMWNFAIWTGSDSSQAVQHHNVTVPSVSANGAFQASLTFACRGYSYATGVDPNHHVITKLNGSTLDDFTMTDYEVREASQTFNQSLLGGSGDRSIDFTHEVTDPALLGITTDAVVSNWFELTYARQFVAHNDKLSFTYGSGSFQFQVPGFSSPTISLLDVSTATSPVLLTGAQISTSGTSQVVFQDVIASENTYLATLPVTPSAVDFIADTPSNLAGMNPDTQWILIAPEAWVNDASIQNLNAIRQAQGLNPAVVSVTDIYDEFSYGLFSPYAIKDFLQSVYDLADPANLKYVVLLGDADYDYKDYIGDGNFNLVPTYMVADPGLASAFHPYSMHSFDNYFGSFDGDSIPEIFIGRIPVRTLIRPSKRSQKYLITNRSWIIPGSARMFSQRTAKISPRSNRSKTSTAASCPTPVLMRPTKCTFDWRRGTARAKMPTTIRSRMLWTVLNAGQVVTSWLGHGGFLQWGQPGYLASSDLTSLTNSAKPTVMLNANCFTGAFYHAATSALMEDLMARPKGVVSGFGPGTYMFSFQGGPATEYSIPTRMEKIRKGCSGFVPASLHDLAGDERILQGMVAFGDPAGHLAIPALDPPQFPDYLA